MKFSVSTILKFLFSIGIGLGLVFYLQSNITSEEQQQIIHGIENIPLWLIVLSVILAGLACILRAFRWKMLLLPMGYQPRNSTLISSIFIMYLGNLIFPRLGEILRCSVLFKEDKVPLDKGIGTMITERLVDIIGLGFYVVLAFIFEFNHIIDFYQKYNALKGESNFLIPLTIACIVLVLGIILWRVSKLRDFILTRIYGVLEGLQSILKLKNPLLFISLSIGIYVLYFLSTYILFFAFTETSSLSLGCALVVLIAGTLGVGLTQGGIGAYQVLVTWTLGLYGVHETIAQTYSWAAWILPTASLVFFGLVSWAFLLKRSYDKTK